jgi:O-succinylbenzoic acid--CoA ligase
MFATHSAACHSLAAAHLLRQAGAQRGRPIAAITSSSEALAILAYAAPLLGTPLFPIDPALPETVIGELIGQVGECLIVGDGQTVSTQAILAAECGAAVSLAFPDGPAVLIATSGSSGRPKVVVLTGGNLVAAAAASAKITPLRPGDRWLACLPLFHIGGFSIIARCALAGAEAVLQQGFDAERVCDALTTGGISHVSLTPTMLAQMLALGRAPPRDLRHVLVGGAALSCELAQRAASENWPIQPTYGMSETGSQLATLPRLPAAWRPGHVGKPLDGAEISLDGEGRLKVCGPMVMQGYANLMLSPGDGLDSGWFTTSDLAEITPEGELFILGHADEVIVTGGKKIHPAGVENLLAQCPGVDGVGVAGRPDPVWGEIVTAIFAGVLTPPQFLDWCHAHISGAFRPRAAIRVDALPLLANGKPDRLKLRELVLGDDPESGPIRQL